jgi:hypothetical protein
MARPVAPPSVAQVAKRGRLELSIALRQLIVAVWSQRGVCADAIVGAVEPGDRSDESPA